MDAANYIDIRGTQYKVEPVSKIYFRGLTECLRDLGDVDLLSKSAKTIKKVIIPTIPDNVVLKGEGDDEFYLWHPSAEPEEINDLILKCARCYRLQKLEEAKAKGDNSAIAEHTEGLNLLEKYLGIQNSITVESQTVNTEVVALPESEHPQTPIYTQEDMDELKAQLEELRKSQK